MLQLNLFQQSIEPLCTALVKFFFCALFNVTKTYLFQLFGLVPDLDQNLGRSHRFQACLVVEVRMFLRRYRHGFSYQPEYI